MVLSYIFIAFFVVAFLVALVRTIGYNLDIAPFTDYADRDIFATITQEMFGMAEYSLMEIALPLGAVWIFWMGIMKVAEEAGAVKKLSRAISPLFEKLFPEVPKGHPAQGAIMMNVAANMLGLDNAATPFGLKAMDRLQELNPKKDTASNSMIMFLVLNTSGLTLIPASIIGVRLGAGAENPTDIFLPILLATFVASLVGLIIVSLWQKINLLQPVVLAYLAGATALIAALVSLMVWVSLDANGVISGSRMDVAARFTSNFLILGIIVLFLLMAWRRKLDSFGHFIEGAKEGWGVIIKVLPYLLGILVAIAAFRASGAFDIIVDGMRWFFALFTSSTEFVDALPTALMRPISGGGARGMMVETMKTHGPDSFAGTLSAVFQGTTETTFYVIAVYFGSVGIKHTRYAIPAGLLADLAGIIAAIGVCYLFFSDRL